MKEYILTNAKKMASGELFSFLKSFVRVLIEAIIQCLTSVFRMIWRVVKEAFVILTNSFSVLSDPKKSIAEKGDAILNIAATSVAGIAGIYIEEAINSAGIPEPFSIILASIASAVVLSGMVYLLKKMDILNVNHGIRRKRIDELFDQLNDRVSAEVEYAEKESQLTLSQAPI
ncbi:MAG: hypothetical protein JEY82_16225 [Maridesulfovibrio ferrireducens]|nr:hypothetical protein [Maridesulfovibrio ferrireducens]